MSKIFNLLTLPNLLRSLSFFLLLLLVGGVTAESVSARNEYAEILRLRSKNESVHGIRSMADGEHYTVLKNNNIVRYRYDSETAGEQLLPATGLKISDYTFSPDEQRILIASGRTPIYRRSYTTTYHLATDGKVAVALPDAANPRDASFSPDGRLTEMIELPDHPWFVATQAHPEFKSRPNKPHPLFRDFVAAAKK